ncbi:uncharacterized protein LOC118743430 [Rhagoletis pomonella]|uniref:uncharacterized protein LOC118743430 n=1 Tax=Rhagoletis pomonella TaxID=28610 RepID=UPI00177AEFA5|nr:uncharacterized protein LOC118743430 [Rhagoletis pomonella]
MTERKSDADGVFSVRLVIADFYVEKPMLGFDPCYSEFRGKEIRRVPIIRVFGSSADGRKTCMHVHGVFPYFYIPYEAKEFESLNKAIYQITSSIDKAINISLGQASSNAQHVFKVQLVKGIPFYGYHRTEHQFLKIYMYNPRFVRRAANLLQSGAILNRNFHPYESHVPYILQFMIDYNLYGMSFVHVPLEVVKFRHAGDENNSGGIFFPEHKEPQALDSSVAKKQSTCALEVDIGSNFILNRFQLTLHSNDTKTHSNPGIEAIWNDERLRRQRMAEKRVENVPPLEIPASQERTNVPSVESEIFHKTVLQSKLLALNLSTTFSGCQLDQSINSTLQTSIVNFPSGDAGGRDQKRTFNLSKIVGNAIYPEECTPNENLINASFIENHLSNSSFTQSGSLVCSAGKPLVKNNSDARGNSILLDDTVIDEELLLNITTEIPQQLNTSLCAEDMELLDILKQLEEHEEDGNHIDLDSTLAPLTQAHKKFNPSPELLDKQVGAAAVSQPFPDSDTDSNEDENGNPLDFSIALENMEELILKFTQSQPTEEEGSRIDFPQVDGSDDLVPKTPTKTGSRLREGNSKNVKTSPCTPRTPSRGNLSPKRSPRTPKSSASKKYAPLPLKITCKKTDKSENKGNEITPVRRSVMRNLDIGSSVSKSAKITLSKKLAISALRRKSVDWSPSTMQQQHISRNEESGSVKRTPIRRSRNTKDLDRTHITCELTPRRKSERILKVYSIEEAVSKEIKPPANQIQSICQNYEPNSVTETSHSNSPRDIKETAGLNTQRKSIRLVDDSRTVSRYSSTTSQIQPGNPCVTERTQSLNIRKCVVKLRKTVIRTNCVSPKNPAAVKKVAGKEGGKEKQITMLKQQQPTNCISIPTGHEYNLKENDAQLWLEENTASPLNESNESDEIAASDIEDDTNSIGAKRLRRSFHLVQRKKMLKNKVFSNNYIHGPAEGVDEINEFSASPTTDVRIDDDYADIENLHIQSFYDASFTEDLSSPLNYSDGSSHVIDLARQIHSSNRLFSEYLI